MKIVWLLLCVTFMLCGCQSRSEDKKIIDIASEYSLEQLTIDEVKKLEIHPDDEVLKQANYILKTKSDTIIIISSGVTSSFGVTYSKKDIEVINKVKNEYPEITNKEFLSEYFPEIYSLNLIFNGEEDSPYWEVRLFSKKT